MDERKIGHLEPEPAGVKPASEVAQQVSRRTLFKQVGAGAAIGALGVSTAADAQAPHWDEETDIVIVGSGAAALSAAAAAVQNGAKIVMLEKGPVSGGTTAKSGGAHWIPNNQFQQARGFDDPRDEAVRYMVRVAYPYLYRANHPTFGISQPKYDLIANYYDNASRVVKRLTEAGVMKAMMMQGVTGPLPDYQGQLPESRKVHGRTLCPVKEDGSPGWGGDFIRQFSTYLASRGVVPRLENRVTRIVREPSGRVTGVEVLAPEGVRSVRARSAVIFGSGGFAFNLEMREDYLRTPIMGGCAAPTNEGDFVRMGIEVGAKLGHMNEAWMKQEAVEEVLKTPSTPEGAFILGGDSMIVVNKLGHRMYDETHVYNERGRTHAVWDPSRAEYVQMYQFLLFDDHARRTGGEMMPAPNTKLPSYVISAQTWDELSASIQQRLDMLADRIGTFALAPDFPQQLKTTIERYNSFAETGKDLDFGRGSLPIGASFHAPNPDNDKPNKLLYPFAKSGPYYCTILCAGTLDTKGGPIIDTRSRVMDVHDQPIPGLYAAGNCAASPAGQAYWGAGGTIGPAITYGFIAGEQASSFV